MFEDLETWWQNVNPQTLAAIETAGKLIVILLAGHILGGMVTRVLRAKNFDAALRLPGASAAPSPSDHGITPTFFAGLLVRLTVWSGAVWWLALQFGRPDLAATLGLIVSRAWALAGMLVVALGLGSVLAQRLIDCLESPKTGLEHMPHRNGTAGSHRSVAGAVGAGAYVLVVLLVLLMAADFSDWPLTRSAAVALWQLAQHVLIAVAALAIGFLGARAARDLATSDGAASPEKRAGQFTAVGIVAATTVLAVGMLLSSTGVLIGLAALAVLGLAFWLLRGYLPDLTAGLQLRTNKVREVCFDDTMWQVADVGLLTSELCRNGQIYRMQNQKVLAARCQGVASEVAAR